MASTWTTGPRPRPKPRRGLVSVGLALLVLGGLTVYDASAISFYQSTFNVLPLKFFKITDSLKDQTTISGQFQETSGRPIKFYIMNSVQFAAFQIGQSNASLFSVVDKATASVAYTFTTPDTYYLVFAHGSGLLGATETVSFQRSYYNLSRFELFSGIVLLGLGVLEVYWGVRPRDAGMKRLIKQSGTSNGQP